MADILTMDELFVQKISTIKLIKEHQTKVDEKYTSLIQKYNK